MTWLTARQMTEQRLLQISKLRRLPIHARDGEIGHVGDFYFDDQTWHLRYVIADIGSWLEDRRVLLSPVAIISAKNDHLSVDLTKALIKDSPSIDHDKPISRQFEVDLFNYYSWTPYWRPSLLPGDLGSFVPVPPITKPQQEELEEEVQEEKHLRSIAELQGYSIETNDGQIGSVSDWVVRRNQWQLRYMVVDTGNWLPGKKVILPPSWIEEIDWSAMSVRVDLAMESVRNAPELDIEQLNEAHATQLSRHYGREIE